jgi:hypothetical protein
MSGIEFDIRTIEIHVCKRGKINGNSNLKICTNYFLDKQVTEESENNILYILYYSLLAHFFDLNKCA